MVVVIVVACGGNTCDDGGVTQWRCSRDGAVVVVMVLGYGGS